MIRSHRAIVQVFLTSICLFCALACSSSKQQMVAFPGAEGFGAMTTGGRGGEVYEVTSLEDSGPGSLRDAVSQPDRTIVFRVAGTIQLKKRLDLKSPNLTIAGQSATGGGICVRDYCVYVMADNIIIRHLRFRLGDVSKEQSDALDIWKNGPKNIIIDHCSVSWSVDEGLSLAGDQQNITIQWCFITEALRHSVHKKGDHGFGSLSRSNGPVTWHHNLWAHNDSRNPRLGDNYGKAPFPVFDVRNNVIYDYGGTASGLTQGNFSANYIGNYIKAGPSSSAKTAITVGDPSDLKFYVDSNYFAADPKQSGEKLFSELSKDGKQLITILDQPIASGPVPVTTTSAEQAYHDVLNHAGAILPQRDATDNRIVDQVKNGTGKFIDSQSEVGGWPVLESGTPIVDTDHDGMPDDWEIAHKLNPNNASDGKNDFDKDGYTNLEECLNGTDPYRR